MNQREAVLTLGAVLLAVGVAAVLLVGSLATGAGEPGGPRRVFFEARGAPRAQAPIVRPGESPPRVPDALRPIVPIERGVASAAREAAGYLLLLLAIAATTLFAREQVLASYHATLGGWRSQLRTVGTGLAILALALSAAFLTSVAFLGALFSGVGPRAAGAPPFIPAGLAVQFGLQTGFAILAVLFVLVLLPALVGMAAASWRLGDALLGVRPLRRWSGTVPRPLVALLGATAVFLLTQVPYAGAVVAVATLAYALGAFVTARLEPQTPTRTP